jgi:hypothetical protein
MESDAELIGRSLAGDGEAFVEVICRHEAAVGAYLARRAGRGLAEDLLSDVWSRLLNPGGPTTVRFLMLVRGCSAWR